MTTHLQGYKPDDEQQEMIKKTAEHWRKISTEAPVQSLTRVEDAAKQLVGLTGVLQGLYFAVFVFSDFKEVISGLFDPVIEGLALIASLSPVLLWLISLYCATRVFVPRWRSDINLEDMSVDAWQRVKKSYEAVVDKKLKWLHRSHVWLIGSFSVVFLLLLLVAFLPSQPKAGPTQIILLTPTPGLGVMTPTPLPTP